VATDQIGGVSFSIRSRKVTLQIVTDSFSQILNAQHVPITKSMKS
jgi:hypothetical protein